MLEKQFTDGTEDFKAQGHAVTWQVLYTWVILKLAVLDLSSEEFTRSFFGHCPGRSRGHSGRWFGDREKGKRIGQGVTSNLRNRVNS